MIIVGVVLVVEYTFWQPVIERNTRWDFVVHFDFLLIFNNLIHLSKPSTSIAHLLLICCSFIALLLLFQPGFKHSIIWQFQFVLEIKYNFSNLKNTLENHMSTKTFFCWNFKGYQSGSQNFSYWQKLSQLQVEKSPREMWIFISRFGTWLYILWNLSSRYA